MATKRLKNYFFKITQTALKRGVRFRTGDKPAQTTFEDLVESSIFSTESKDRAKEDTGGFNSDTNGHVVAATDVQAKANQAKPTDRTLVVQPSQLPTVESSSDLTITSNNLPHAGDALETVVGGTTNNIFNLSLSDSFKAFMIGLVSFIDTMKITADALASTVSGINGRVAANEQIIGTLTGGTFTGVVPIGSVSMWLSDTAIPATYVELNGDEVDQTTYSALFALLGSKYNEGNESPGNFRLPNMSNRSPRGYEEDSSITRLNTPQVLGAKHGLDGVYLETDNIPAHTHFAGGLKANLPDPEAGEYGLIRRTLPGNGGTISGNGLDSIGSGDEPDLLPRPLGALIPVEGETSPSISAGTALEIIPSVMLTKFIMKAL